MRTGRNNPCLLYLLLRTFITVSMKKGRKTNGTIGDKGVKKETTVYRDCMDMRDRENVVTSYPEEDIVKLSQLI